VLCLYLEFRCKTELAPHGYKGYRVLELGSGPGLSGILIAHLGANVTLTDLASVVPITRHNAELNAVDPSVQGSLNVEELEWGVDIRSWSKSGGYFDLIIGTELIYRDELHGLLLITLLQLMTADTEVLFAHARRAQSQFDRWKKRFGRYLDIEEVVSEAETQAHTDQGLLFPGDELISVWRIRLLGPPVYNEDLSELFAYAKPSDPADWLSLLAVSESDLETVEVCAEGSSDDEDQASRPDA